MAQRVVVVGDALIDELRGEHGSREFVGGAALNVAVGLAVLGHRPTLLAMVGDDEDGTTIRGFLEEHGVELLATRAPNGSSRAVSDRTAGEPRYIFNTAALNRRINFDSAQRKALADADLVAVSCFPFDDQFQADALAESVQDPERRLVIDANPRPGLIHDLDRFATNANRASARAALVKIGDEDAELLYGTSLRDAEEQLLGLGARAVLATAGRHGAGVATKDGIRVHESIVPLPGPIVDTMGAGDATTASVTDSLLRADRRDLAFWQSALARAMGIAAATCRAEGALLRLP
jgi:sugar/nucleoside kinase (ribokinase family)